MPRKATATPEFKESLVDDAQASEGSRALDVQSQVMTEQETRTFELAQRLGYEGALTVGGLEDEIRFYQRQTVESMLQVGKRLLMLKEMTAHGEFEKRVELLGFAERTARRFMSAAAKTAKSATVAVLADRVKNQKAFLELITHDDDVIDSLAEMDEFDKMSASQLRAKARDLKGEYEEALDLSAKKSKEIDKLKLKVGKIQVAPTDWPVAFSVLFDQASGAAKDLSKAISAFEAVFQTGNQVEPAGEHEEVSLEGAKQHLAESMQAAFNKGLKDLFETAMLFEKTLGARAEPVVYPS